MKQKQRMRAFLRISVSREKPSTGYWEGVFPYKHWAKPCMVNAWFTCFGAG